MAQIQHKSIVKVIEQREVTYKTHKLLFFKWYEKMWTTKVGNSIYVQTNLPIDDVWVNGTLYTK